MLKCENLLCCDNFLIAKTISQVSPPKAETSIDLMFSPIKYQSSESVIRQSTEMGIIFISSNDFDSAPGSEWIIGTCVKSPCVAAGNNELTSVYR